MKLSEIGQKGIDELPAAIMMNIYHLLGLASNIISMILVVRFFLNFFQLTPDGFSSWAYQLSRPLVAPFGGLLILYHVSSAAAYLIDGSTVIAIVVYAIGFGLLRARFNPSGNRQGAIEA